MTENTAIQPVAYSVEAAVKATGGALSRTRIFALIAAGELDARRAGRRTIVMAASLHKFLESLPAARAA
jgi:hypothetical protein